MPAKPKPRSTRSPTSPVRARILQQAREYLFARGCNSLTMAELATELGMSKKTLYVHFAGKEPLLREVILEFGQEVRAGAEIILRDPTLNFAEKLHRFAESMIERLSHLNPHLIRDLQRYAPELHRLTEQVRRENIPFIFGRLIREGQRAGMVRAEVNPLFATEFLLHAMQGLHLPASLQRLHLAPQEVFRQAINLFFGGLLTPAGRKDYEKLFPR